MLSVQKLKLVTVTPNVLATALNKRGPISAAVSSKQGILVAGKGATKAFAAVKPVKIPSASELVM